MNLDREIWAGGVILGVIATEVEAKRNRLK